MTLTRRISAFICLCSLALAQGAWAAEAPSTREYKASMKRMMAQMHIAYSGQVDTDFARGMIPHHQAAIRMADTVLEHGADDADIRSLANWIKVSQEAEIGIMQRWLATRGTNEPAKTSPEALETAAVKHAQADMQTMHRDMDIIYSGDALHDFVCGMIPHHQGAIDMAFNQLSYGSRPEMLTLARGIVRSQKGDIARMQAWLNRNNLSCKTQTSTPAHHHH